MIVHVAKQPQTQLLLRMDAVLESSYPISNIEVSRTQVSAPNQPLCADPLPV